VAFIWRSYVVWKHTGINPVTFKGSDTAHDFIGRVFKLVFVIVVLVCFVYSFSPVAYTVHLANSVARKQMVEIDWCSIVSIISGLDQRCAI
jgi:hypothetical protein